MPVVDVTVPVRDEAHVLEPSIERLHAFLTDRFEHPFRLTIAENASTDATLASAHALAERLRDVRVLHLDEPGRGRALRSAWTTSDADVVAYMDVDLSTDLDGLAALIDPVVAGTADVAIGSRLAPGAQVTRSRRRTVISHAYSAVLRWSLHCGFRDAQCGFKALRGDLARQLVPQVVDDGWFFDSELLVVAERAGLTIVEVPVTWVEDHDSRVRIVRTAIEDLRGIVRLRRSAR